jgi:hypothetical protein
MAWHHLLQYLPTVKNYVDSGQLRLFSHEDWYGDMDPETVVGMAATVVTAAYEQGWDRVRACGSPVQPAWGEGWSNLLRYERMLHEMIRTSDLVVLCSYRLGRIPNDVRIELLQHHHASLIDEQGGWHYAPVTCR